MKLFKIDLDSQNNSTERSHQSISQDTTKPIRRSRKERLVKSNTNNVSFQSNYVSSQSSFSTYQSFDNGVPPPVKHVVKPKSIMKHKSPISLGTNGNGQSLF